MRIVFFGTGKFGIPTLEKLIESSHEVAAVVTQPDQQKGRGWKVQPAPVKAFIEEKAPRIEVLQPENIRNWRFISNLRKKRADVFVVVDYGRFLSSEVLEAPKKFCINLHPSLLPKYRGAAPVNWAILNGDKETGNSIIVLTEQMDAGSIILQEKTYIGDEENALELSERLSKSGADLMLKALELMEEGLVELVDQDESEASFAPKLEKKQGRIEWSESAIGIVRQIRGMQPWPGAFTYLEGKMLKILKAQVVMDIRVSMAPGSICDEDKFIIATGKGAVEVKELQMEGKKAMSRDEFLRGQRIKAGTILGIEDENRD